MALSLIATANAFNPGADLWILPEPDHSKWCSRLDWYMNFQVSRLLGYMTPELSEPLQAMLSASGINEQKVVLSPNAPLLVSTQKLLPNQWTVCVPYGGKSLTNWVDEIQAQVVALNFFRIRVFYPKGISQFEVERYSKDLSLRTDVTYLIEH